jgi:hypothetical protein
MQQDVADLEELVGRDRGKRSRGEVARWVANYKEIVLCG